MGGPSPTHGRIDQVLRSGLPRSDWITRDPYALRNGLAIAIIALVLLKGQDWRSELRASVAPAGPAPIAVAVDAWITPPGYTGKPPILLTSEETMRRLAGKGEIVVPENSALIVRFNNAKAPKLRLTKPLEDGAPGETLLEPEVLRSLAPRSMKPGSRSTAQ